MEVVRINDVIIEKISANDKELSRIFGHSSRACGIRRREMQKLPSQAKYLRDGMVTVAGFDSYLQYRKSPEWEKEVKQMEKMGIYIRRRETK
ncbi:hypothetical protein [Streptococcus minor]|uniref:hypothetical protein n=1 Tax=Streptococcus minor TaxID=229549 RepID=UPI000364DD79|nr:hypothetical protein [Streptococcus minor]